MKTRGILIIVGILLMVLSVPAWAVDERFPTKPVHIWIGWGPGGSSETLIRTGGPIIEKVLGQPIVIENKPGGTGSLAMGLLKNAKPDGYTLGVATDSPFTRIPHTIGVKYDPLEDFTYILMLTKSRHGVVVQSGSPFKRFQDVIEFARKNPGQLTHATPGVANATHLGMEKIAQIEKVKMQHIYFQGAPQTITAILGGHVMVASSVAQSWIPHVKAGTLRPLLSYNNEGLDEWPEVPTLKKLGYDFEVPLCEVIAAPKGVPKPIMDKLVAAFSEALKSPQVLNVAQGQASIISDKPLSGDALYKFIETQFNFYGQLIKEMGLQKK
jgi:tripartite-type tricarboxylate transporter receptor subunit TctC